MLKLFLTRSYQDELDGTLHIRHDVRPILLNPPRVKIPHMNTNIAFTEHLPDMTINRIASASVDGAVTKQFPKEFDWRNIHPGDTEEMKRKKGLVTRPQIQALCGSCSYIATATTLSDVYIISGGLTSNPDLSSTYMMACQGGDEGDCKGSNPALNMKHAAEIGVSTNDCIDYSFCLNDPVCVGKGDSSKHFQTIAAKIERFNKKIPTCGECKEVRQYKRYFAKDPHVINMKNDSMKIDHIIKNHILTIGPVCAGFHAYENFIRGDFSATAGVYIDSFDYAAGRPGKPGRWIGSHAVTCLGWGKTEYDGTTIPYWYCRNSWGEEWGPDGGYFKIAMYPINKRAQLEHEITVFPQNIATGGFIAFAPGKIETFTPKRKIEQ